MFSIVKNIICVFFIKLLHLSVKCSNIQKNFYRYDMKSLISDPFGENAHKDYFCENLIFNLVEDILIFMEDNEISKKEVATRLGIRGKKLEKMLKGDASMTLNDFFGICFVLGIKPEIKIPMKGEVCDGDR